MQSPILVGTDFSSSSESAFLVALHLAQKTKAHLHIAHTFIPPFVDPNTPVSLVDALHEQNQAIFKGKLDDLVQQAQAAGVSAHAHLIFSDVPSGLTQKAKEIDAQLIVVGKTGESGFIQWFVGSNATHLLNKSEKPLLMIPGGYSPSEFTKLIYATQLEYDETEILQKVKSLQTALGASITFIKMDVEGQPNIQPDHGYEKTIRILFDQDVERQKSNDLVEDLHAYTVNTGGQMLITASHYRNFITQLIEPSITKKILNAAEVPVLVFQFAEISI